MSIRKYKSIQPSIAERVFIDSSSAVIGKVQIGDDSSVWPMVVIRGDVHDISIGKRTNVQDGCVLHVTHDGPYCPGGRELIIGDDVTIGHKAVLHACTIENLCLIGIGCIIMDNAIIKQHVLLGAGSMVPPGKILDGGYLWMGSPAKKIRVLSDKEMAFFAYSAKKYVELKDQYYFATPSNSK